MLPARQLELPSLASHIPGRWVCNRRTPPGSWDSRYCTNLGGPAGASLPAGSGCSAFCIRLKRALSHPHLSKMSRERFLVLFHFWWAGRRGREPQLCGLCCVTSSALIPASGSHKLLTSSDHLFPAAGFISLSHESGHNPLSLKPCDNPCHLQESSQGPSMATRAPPATHLLLPLSWASRCVGQNTVLAPPSWRTASSPHRGSHTQLAPCLAPPLAQLLPLGTWYLDPGWSPFGNFGSDSSPGSVHSWPCLQLLSQFAQSG